MSCGGSSERKAFAQNVRIHLQSFANHGSNRGWLWIAALLISALVMLALSSSAQTSLPFEVSNPKHLNWRAEEAGRIYASACELVARSVRPEKPPRLQPKFVLVLGAKEDETVRNGATAEVHLKTWNPARFAEAMVIVAMREVLKKEDVTNLTRDTLIAAQASVSVNELKRKP
jgi:hypothetical protein